MGSEVPPMYEPALQALSDEFDLELLELIWENGNRSSCGGGSL
jgi:hypothetical protein